MNPYLHFQDEAGGAARIEIAKFPFVVGRHPRCDGRLDDPSVSQRHVRIDRQGEDLVLEDLQSTNGTKVRGARVERHVLAEGDAIELGTVRVVYSLSPEPPPVPALSEAEAPPPPRRFPIVPVAAAAGVVLSCAVALAIHALGSGREEAALPGAAGVAEEPRGAEAGGPAHPARTATVEEEIVAAEGDLAGNRPDRAKARFEVLKGREATDAERARIADGFARAKVLEPAIAALREALEALERDLRTLAVELAGRAVEVQGTDEESIYVAGGTEVLTWRALSSTDVYRLLVATGADRVEPLGSAAVALSSGDESAGLALFARFLEASPGALERVNQVYAFFSPRRPPEGGWILIGDRLGTRADLASRPPETEEPEPEPEPEKPAAQDDARKKELERLQSELARLGALEEARRAARENFENDLATINVYVQSLDYERAIRDLEALSAELRRLGADDLLAVADLRLFDARGMRALFRRLIDDLNAGRLAKKPSWQTASKLYEDVGLAGADADGVKVVLPQAEIQLRWRVLDAARLVGFFDFIRLAVEDRYYLGKICLDRGLESAAHRHWIQVAKSAPPEYKQAVDRNLAEHLGTSIPPGGFVVHGSELVHPEIKANLEKGLVRFRGQWMTKEELAKAQSGLVQYRGEWITRSEKESFEALEREESLRAKSEGFVRENGAWVYRHRREIDGQVFLTVGGKFYPADKAREMRAEWANAWTLKTEHFDLRTNMPDDFATEWADFMEASWRAYVEYFGVELDRRLELYAFRTYDDYRNYCQETGNLGNLKAGGFADPTNGRGVGWRSGRTMDSLFFTMIHEGAHLYHFYAFKTPIVPSWYAEGTATQFEGYRWDSSTRTLTLDYVSPRIGTVKAQVLAGNALRLADFVRANAGESINEGGGKAQTFYATAWAFKNFLDRATDPVVRRMANEFKSEMEGGEFRTLKVRGVLSPGEDPLERVFGADLAWLQTKWEDYVRGLK